MHYNRQIKCLGSSILFQIIIIINKNEIHIQTVLLLKKLHYVKPLFKSGPVGIINTRLTKPVKMLVVEISIQNSLFMKHFLKKVFIIFVAISEE